MQSLLVILIVITGIILPTQVKGEREDYILLISSYNHYCPVKVDE